jgi:putative FmdB family regulatory protein
MPFYEYQCEKCGHDVEVMQKVSDAPLKKCPKCGKSSMKRLMSAPVFRLKGSGWYETDFKSDQDNKRNLADKPEPEAKDDKAAVKKDDAKADTKVEAKAADSPAKPAPAADKPAAKSVAKSRTAGTARKKTPAKAKAKRRR